MSRRVVITGMGVIAPLGIGIGPFWENLTQGRSAVGPITLFDTGAFPVRIAAEIKDFDPKAYIKQRKSLKVMARDIQLAVACANIAMSDAGLDQSGKVDPRRIGTSLGAGLIPTEINELAVAIVASRDGQQKFDMRMFGKEGLEHLFPLWLLKYLPNMLACHVSIIYDLQGPNNTITTACAASAQALGEGFRVIMRGDADVMVCGGSDSKINPLSMVRYTLLKVLSTRNDAPDKASRPFDRDRDGMVVGEGAGILIFEELEHARKRGARIYAEIGGFGSTSDAHMDGLNCADGSGRDIAMKAALDDARVNPSEVDFICAHAIGGRDNDAYEAAALRRAFGETTARTPVTSLKSGLGQMGAGGAAVEAVACALATRDGVIPPTLNCDNPDPEVTFPIVREPRRCPVRTVLCNASSFAGQNAGLVIKKFEG
jgi:3-oxoacyl-[acyl-carrier-protein] synthase II